MNPHPSPLPKGEGAVWDECRTGEIDRHQGLRIGLNDDPAGRRQGIEPTETEQPGQQAHRDEGAESVRFQVVKQTPLAAARGVGFGLLE